MKLKNEVTRIYNCCECGKDLEEGGPINTFLKTVTKKDSQVNIKLFSNGSFEIRELGWRARFKLTPYSTDEMKVTIYCYSCDSICEY